MMAAKASIYQAQGNLEEAARSLMEINWQTSSSATFVVRITQLRLERNYGEAIRLLQARLAHFPFGSDPEKAFYQLTLVLCSVLLAIRLGQRLPLNRRAIHTNRSTEINQERVRLRHALSRLCPGGGEGFGSKASGACNRASPRAKDSVSGLVSKRTWR